MKLAVVRSVYKGLHNKCYSSSAINTLKVNPSEEVAVVTTDNQFKLLSQSVTPLANLEYAEQLNIKQKFTKSIIQSIYTQKHLPKFKTKISKIIPSPVTDRYRNKDEFSVNRGVDGDPKTIGFYVRSPYTGEVVCVPPTELINIKKNHIEISQFYQEFISVSPLRACLDFRDGGFWRNLIVRSNQKGETMVAIIVHPNGAHEELIDETMKQLTDFFSGRNINSLYYQSCPHTRCSNSVAPFKLLYGKKYLFEELGPYKFQISPDSFFQINSSAAEILYTYALKLADASKRSSLLDLCSGIGVFSIFASSEVRGCIGIEVLEEAVKDAKINAKINNVSNCDFIAGNVEQKLVTALNDLNCSPDIVGILNPGRGGVTNKTIKILRSCPTLRTLIYISCKADNPVTMKNFINLLNPKFDDTAPFILSQVQPVDMFPHTNHCELIMVFKR